MAQWLPRTKRVVFSLDGIAYQDDFEPLELTALHDALRLYIIRGREVGESASCQVVGARDDIDGSVAEENVVFGLEGQLYAIYLTGGNARELRQALAPYIERATRVEKTPA